VRKGFEAPADVGGSDRSLADRIQEAYERPGHQLGWRFLASPARTLSQDTDLAFVGLNPGRATYRLAREPDVIIASEDAQIGTSH
jgi:hypothetical protein